MPVELPPKEPSDLDPEWELPEDGSDLEFPEMPSIDEDDAPWEVFIPDDDEWDPVPDSGDFWIDSALAVAC